MRYIFGKTEFSMEHPTAVTIGKFDGFHKGHQKLLNQTLALQKEGLTGVVFSMQKNQREMLMTKEEKKDYLESRGLDCLIECPFVPEITQLDPEIFVREFLVDQLKAAAIIVGKDFRFGKNRAGDVSLLLALQEELGYRAIIVEKELWHGKEISSTLIKEELAAGHMEHVRELLGYPYSVNGRVLHGKHLGRTLGMPTTNLLPDSAKKMPPFGVYISDSLVNHEIYHGVTNIGKKPTVGEFVCGVETYLFDFNRDIYGEKIKVQLYRYERPEQKFASIPELKNQMQKDIQRGKEYFGDRNSF